MTDDIIGYNWQAEAGQDTFLSWFIPTVLARIPGDKDRFEEFAAINGIPVSSKGFMEGVERNMRYMAERQAQEIVRENANLEELNEIVANMTDAVKEAMSNYTRGTVLENWNDRDRW